jgi:hypothetical protein
MKECPHCEATNVETFMEEMKWLHITYTAPVNRCRVCGGCWCDSDREDAHTKALLEAGYILDEKGNVVGQRG